MSHPADLCGFAGIATLMPLLGLRRTPATRTCPQKFSCADLGLVGYRPIGTAARPGNPLKSLGGGPSSLIEPLPGGKVPKFAKSSGNLEVGGLGGWGPA